MEGKVVFRLTRTGNHFERVKRLVYVDTSRIARPTRHGDTRCKRVPSSVETCSTELRAAGSISGVEGRCASSTVTPCNDLPARRDSYSRLQHTSSVW